MNNDEAHTTHTLLYLVVPFLCALGYTPHLVQARACPSMKTPCDHCFDGFLTMVCMVKNSTLGGCVLIAEGKRGWVMFVIVPLAHNNILIGTATQCYLFCCGFQP